MLEWLKTILGDSYTEDIDKKVSAEIGKEFVSRTDFNAANEEKKTMAKTIKERDGQLEELKKVDAAGLQAEIVKLQGENKTAQEAYDKQLKQIKIETALETRLLKEGAVNTKAVKALLDPAKISLDGENIVGLDDQLKALKESEKWAFTPQTPPGKSGAKQGTPPNPGDGTTIADEIKSAVYGQ
jgi:hypothetical protein